MGQQRVVLARLRHRLVLLTLYSYPRIARPNHEVPAVPVQKRTVEDLVADLQIYVGAFHHRPVLVVAQEEARAVLMEKLAFDTLASADALAERGQQLLLSISVDDHVLVGLRLPVRDGFAPRCAGD